MNHPYSRCRGSFLAILLFSLTLVASAQTPEPKAVRVSPQTKRFRLVRAFVVDDRLSALRREADIHSPVAQRLRLGRPVFIIAQRNGAQDRNGFCRIALSRRTRGWIHRSALASPAVAGEDARVMELINSYKGFDRLTLCRLFTEEFRRSPHLAKAMLALAEESDRAAVALNRSVARRLSRLKSETDNAPLRDYFLSDPGLDRYSRLGIRFRFDESVGNYFYDGQAYRDIIRLFPRSEESKRARARLQSLSESQARR